MATKTNPIELERHDQNLRAAIESLSPTNESPSSTRLTPESDSESDDGAFADAAKTGEGYEMRELGQNRRDRADWRLLAEQHDTGLEEAEDMGNKQLYTAAEETKVIKKLDRKLVVFMALLYMLSFLDRSNIGNARIAGLEDDLHLSSSQYEWLLTAFYITYIIFEWMTLMYRLVPPHIYISVCVMSWGVLASLQSITTSFLALVILRALLGIGEAAFGPGLPFYLSFFYRRDELALRTGLFISAAPLANSFASSLAWLITKVGHGGPIAPWRLLFLVEGFPSIFVAVFAWWFVPDSPETIKWLDRKERKIAALRLRKEKVTSPAIDEKAALAESENKKGVKIREIVAALKDPKCYLTAFMFFSCNVAFSSMPVFEPTIIHEMGYSALASQALSAPPYLLSFIIVLLTASLSDRFLSRSVPLLIHAFISCTGYLYLALSGYLRLPPIVRYLGLFPACVGFFSSITIIITWTLNNQPSEGRKGTGMAILNVIGQCGPLLGTRLYPDSDGPFYVRGMFVCAFFMAVTAILTLTLRWVLSRANRTALTDWGLRGETEEEGEGLVGGRRQTRDKGPFIYIL